MQWRFRRRFILPTTVSGPLHVRPPVSRSSLCPPNPQCVVPPSSAAGIEGGGYDIAVALLPLKLNDSSATASVTSDDGGATPCRDRRQQPFAATSIWNHPIGSDAILKPAHLFDSALGRPLPAQFHNDQEWFVTVNEGDTEVDWHDGYFGSCKVEGTAIAKVRLPANWTTDCGPNNNAAAILQPDNRTLLQFQPVYRGTPGGPMMGQHFGTVWGHGADTCHAYDCDILGPGRTGAHGGSGLSAIGGAIRVGELLESTPPIRHALKLELFAKQYYFWQPNVTTNETCFRWPAIACDGYAPKGYGGSDPELMPGSLLVVGRSEAAELLPKLRTGPGRKILGAVRDYGAYLVDDTAGPAPNGSAAFCAEAAVNAEVLAQFGWDIRCSESSGQFLSGISASSNASAFYWDLVRIFQALSVVTNNAPASVGGGGAPVVPLAPPICGG